MAYLEPILDGNDREIACLVHTHDCYLLPDQSEMWISTKSAWCFSCAAFVVVEDLVTPESIEEGARKFHAMRAANPVLSDDIFPLAQQQAMNDGLLAQFLSEAEKWRLALASRKSPPHCLRCGSTHYALLPKSRESIPHPAQPGVNIRSEGCTKHASMDAGGLYDTEGRRIPGRHASR
jgi:hypothetical protein